MIETLLLNDFINSYQVNSGAVYKSENTSPGWTSFFKGINSITSTNSGVGVYLTTPSTSDVEYKNENIQFSFGLTNNYQEEKSAYGTGLTPYVDTTNYYQNIEFGFYFNIGPYGNTINPIVNGNIITSENIPYFVGQYKISFVSGSLEISAGNDVLFSFPTQSGTLQINMPLWIVGYSYNTFNYPLLFSVDYVGVDTFSLVSVTPNINSPMGLINPILLTFNNQIEQSTINTENITYSYSGYQLTDYIVNISNNYSIEISFGTPRNFGTVYEISISGLSDIYGDVYNGNVYFITVAEGASEIVPLQYNTNISDTYWKLNNIFKLLNIDEICSTDFEKFNFSFNPTNLNTLNDTYVTNKEVNLNFNNQEIILNLIQNQCAYNFKNYLEILTSGKTLISENQIPSTSVEDLVPTSDIFERFNLIALFVKLMSQINSYKGNKTQIEFLLNLISSQYSSYNNKVNYNKKLQYNIYTGVPENQYVSSIEPNTHPLGFAYNIYPLSTQNSNFYNNINTSVETLQSLYLANTQIEYSNYNFTYLIIT